MTLEQLLRFHHVPFKPATIADEEREAAIAALNPRPEEKPGDPEVTPSGFLPVGEASKGVV
jgi:hypothetical protein